MTLEAIRSTRRAAGRGQPALSTPTIRADASVALLWGAPAAGLDSSMALQFGDGRLPESCPCVQRGCSRQLCATRPVFTGRKNSGPASQRITTQRDVGSSRDEDSQRTRIQPVTVEFRPRGRPSSSRIPRGQQCILAGWRRDRGWEGGFHDGENLRRRHRFEMNSVHCDCPGRLDASLLQDAYRRVRSLRARHRPGFLREYDFAIRQRMYP